MAGTLSKWYMAKLKSAPLLTNLSTGVVLMTGGDVLAQRVEAKGSSGVIQEESSSSECLDIQNCLRGEQEIMGTSSTSSQQSYSEEHDNDLFLMASDSMLHLAQHHEHVVERLKDTLAFWNPHRTGTMASWVLFYVPFYASLYKAYDRFLPKKTPAGILARVALSFATSVPVNAAFYTYGTMEHTQDWYARWHAVQQQQVGAPSADFRLEQLAHKVVWKLENELPKTIQTSGACWIPFNLLMFTVVPSHMQPLSLMGFSFFWNCYLSMSQHRSSLAAASMTSSMDIHRTPTRGEHQ
ncbi:MAG: hypothetical protein SGILL_007886 [Bacillariaceae sp.]